MTVIRCAVLATFCLSCCGNIFAAQCYQAQNTNNSIIANIERQQAIIRSQLPNLDQLEMNVMDAKTALLEAKVKRGNIKRAEFNLAKAQQTYEREKRKYNDLMEQLDQLEIERVQLSDKYNSSTNVNKLSAEVHPQLQQQAAPKLQNYQHYIPQYPSYSKQNSDVPTVQIESVQLPQRGSYPPKRFSTPNDNFDRTTENSDVIRRMADIERQQAIIRSQLPNLDQLEMNVMDAKTALLEAKAKGGNRKRAEFNLANAQQTYEREKRKYNDLMEQLDQLEIERIQLSDKYNLNANVGERNEEMYQQSWQQATPELPRPLPRYSENSNENDMVLNDLSKNMDDLSNSIEDFNNNGTN